MRHFRQGLLSTLGILAVAFAMYAVTRLAFTTVVADFASYAVVVTGLVAMGFMYRRWNGPLVFTRNGVSLGPLYRFALGGSVLLGPLNVATAIAERGSVPVALAVAMLALSPFLSALSLFGPMLIGSWLFDTWILRSNNRLQTDGPPPVRRG